jgi:hypothetical protein
MGPDSPLWRLPLLLYLGEDAFCLVVLAMGTRGHLAVALDLFLPAHVARLQPVSNVSAPRAGARTRAMRRLLGSLWSPWSS